MIEWDLPEPFSIDVRVEDTDVDRLGHANNSAYLRWCEEVAWAHADAVGLGWDAWRDLDRAMAVRRTELEYLAPSCAGDVLCVANWVLQVDGRLRATRHFQICRPRDELTLLRGGIHYVCIEITSGKPRRMPAEFKRAYVVLPEVAAALAARPVAGGRRRRPEP